MEDLNNNFLTSNDEAFFETGNRTADSEKQCEEHKRHEDQHENQEKSQQESQNISQIDVLKKKIEIQEDKIDNSVVSKRKKNDCNSDSGRFGSEKESNKKSKTSKEWSKEGKESFSFESSDKYSKTLKVTNVKDDTSSGIPRSSEAQNKKRKKTGKEKHAALKYKQESENKGHSKHKDKESDSAEPSMSFESYLNYDVNVFKRKERSAVNKPPKKIKTAAKEEATKDAGMKAFKTPVMSVNVTSPKQVYLTMILKVELLECRP